MSALTEKNKREIEEQYKKLIEKKEKKILLSIYFDLRDPKDGPDISFGIVNFVYQLKEIESAGYSPGTNLVTVVAKWREEDIPSNVAKIKLRPFVTDVRVKIMTPLF